ncbi:MAG: glucose 1-dehydrogenase [Alphaproteobacteria bacterium]|nr:glucose 1-dehydrogenase [Alphaproteobacteria bacterium]
MDLADRVALVTGASRGIGRAAAEALAAAGASVVLTARSADGEEAAAGIRARGGQAHFIRQDVTDVASSARVADEALQRFGRLDVFVANAGVSFSKPTAEMSLAEFRSLLDVNLKAVFFGLQAAVRAMRAGARGGSAILMSSIMGKIGAPGYAHYTAAKGGVRLMAKAAALELGPEKIRVNSIHPGFVRTEMTAAFPEPYMKSLVPMGRIGEADEIARAVVFLASDRSRFMTGAELVLDGGLITR